MEELDSTVSGIDGLDKFTEWIDNFCAANNIVEYKDSDEYSHILHLPPEEIISLTSDECFTNAITLMNYGGLLQKKLDLISSQYSWCVEALNYLFAKQWSNYDKFLPAEIKKQSIISENTYAQSIEKSRLRLYAGIQMLSETCRDIKKRVSLFQDLGKARSFK